MNVDLYEKVWMWAVGVMLALFFGTLANASLRHGFAPPSHVETIDPKQVFAHPTFKQRGVWVDAGGAVHAAVVGVTFAWMPNELSLPANTPVTFHLATPDVTHGFQVVRSNGQAMVVPGYVSQFTTQFEPGEYLIACNEYCGVGHHTMAGKLTVVPKDQWRPPASVGQADGAGAAEVSHAAH
jgi:cytochrome c oxidase subunit 2